MVVMAVVVIDCQAEITGDGCCGVVESASLGKSSWVRGSEKLYKYIHHGY
jgi:hypothetical protein